MSLLLLDVVANIAANTKTTLRYSTQGYDDPNAGGYYAGRVVSIEGLRQDLFSGGSSFGGVRAGSAVAELANADGALDAFTEYAFGDVVEVRQSAAGTPRSDALLMFRGTVEEVVVDEEAARLQLTDRTVELKKDASAGRYQGTNDGAAGYESTAEELMGSRKLRIVGKTPLFQPDLVNRPAQVLALNHDRAGVQAAVDSVDYLAVLTSNGYAEWDIGTAHANLAAFEAATPAQGYYDVYLPAGLVKLGGQLTSDQISNIWIRASAGGADARSAAGVMRWLLLDASVDEFYIDAASVAALHDKNPAATGLVLRDEDYPTALNRVAGYAGAFWKPNRLSVYEFGRVDDPAEVAASLTLKRFDYQTDALADEFNILSIEPSANNDSSMPVWRITAKDRPQVAEDETVLTRWPPRELEFDIYFANDADIQAELDRRLLIYSKKRHAYVAEVVLSRELLKQLNWRESIMLYYPRFGFEGGKAVRLISEELEVKEGRSMRLILWG